MIAGWMLYSLLAGALLTAAAYAASRVCTLLRRPTRHPWLLALLLTNVLSLLALYQATHPSPGPLPSLPTFGAAEAAYTAVSAAAGKGVAPQAVWAVASLTLLLLFATTLVRFRREARRAQPHTIDGVRVLVTARSGPAVIGLLRPQILVPSWLLAEPRDRQCLVIAHEEEHRRAGDALLLAAAWLLVTVLPWNVFLWMSLLRLRLATELDCDARVLRAGVSARSYGTVLLELASRPRPGIAGALALTDSTTHLERRLLAMTEKYTTPSRTRVFATAASALVLVVAACTTEVPTAAEIEDLDAAGAVLQAGRSGFLMQGTPLYVVDGVIVPEARGREIAASQITSIEVVKGAAAAEEYGARGASGVIHITTKDAPASREAAVLAPREPVPTDAPVAVAATKVPGKPLVIIDGVIMAGGLAELDQESIASIEVIKGAAARRLYGERAADGAILVRTKKGG